jgi:3-oxoacyl-[acyl-carrier-protein] synthase II
MKNSRRVVITGLGVVSPIGIGKEAFWESLIAGKSGVDYITAFDPSPYPCHVAAEVKDFKPTDFIRARRAKAAGRFSQFAVAAARLAVEDSKLDLASVSPERIGLCIGTALNGSGDVYEKARSGWGRAGFSGIPTLSAAEFAAHAPAGHISEELGTKGHAITLASACSTGLDTVNWAATHIQEGGADIVLGGSTEAPISEFCFATLCAIGLLAKFDDPPLRASRPYDARRDGLVLGEGSAIYVLEELDHALDRGAHIYSEVLGFGNASAGAFFTNNEVATENALYRAVNMAITSAGKTSGAIDYINAHGNSVPDYDRLETRGFHKAFRDTIYSIPVSSIKSMVGHAMGAAASFQVASTCLSIEHGIIPPTINYETPDPECDLDYVPNTARRARIRTALINAHGVGETHAVLVLGEPEQ